MDVRRSGLDTAVGALSCGLPAASRSTAQMWFAEHALDGPSSSNQDALNLPFQRWYRFKEAFSPRAVVDAFAALNRPPKTCIDPFGGSGTTALTAQFLGIRPTTIEVNPFLADLIEAKLSSYDVDGLMRSFRHVVEGAKGVKIDLQDALKGVPPTFVEPGVEGRWIFSREIAERVLALRTAIDALAIKGHARIMRVLLASTLVPVSNVVISGKGRRYRSGWEKRVLPPHAVDKAFETAFVAAIEDIVRFGRRSCSDYTLLRGDVRTVLGEAEQADFALFSPPYPNSFDYTDIYNIELWMLGYLRAPEENRALREATLRSHVQIKRAFDAHLSTPLLNTTIERLEERRANMWNPHIPPMVGAYFQDLATVLAGLHRVLPPGGSAMMVVGDSRYAGVLIEVGKIGVEIAEQIGFRLVGLSTMRSMRASAQQGGAYDLAETLVHLTRE